jgi:tripartite-type tricarboxylate transporter receptor subunit TctC
MSAQPRRCTRRLPFDPLKDLAPVIQISAFPLALEVHPSVAARSVRELIALAAAPRPDALNFASAGNGTPQHLAGELFDKLAGTPDDPDPLQGGWPALTDLIGGQGLRRCSTCWAVRCRTSRSGKLRPVAVTTLKRSPQLPEVPTLAESGLTGFEFSAWHGIAVQARTPRPIVLQLNRLLNEIFADADFRRRWRRSARRWSPGPRGVCGTHPQRDDSARAGRA